MGYLSVVHTLVGKVFGYEGRRDKEHVVGAGQVVRGLEVLGRYVNVGGGTE